MLKKLLVAMLISLIFLPMFIRPACAQEGGLWYDQSYQEWETKVYDTNASPPSEIFGERYTAAQVQWVVYSLIHFLKSLGIETNLSLCIMNNDANACQAAAENLEAYNAQTESNFAQAQGQGSILAHIFSEKPLSGIGYVREKLTKFHIVPEAKAQGFGFGALSPVRSLWVASRNISYALFVFVIIFFAFAVMLRLKIFSPQAVVTIQSAIPRVVIALILVTFSYAIAGFLVDLVYVVVGVLAMLLANGGVVDSTTNAYAFMIGDIPGGLIGQIFFALLAFALSAYASIFVVINSVLGANAFSLYFAVWWSFLISIIMIIILLIIFLVAFFKILWMLFKAVAMIYLLVIFGPLQITFGSISARGGLGAWAKNLAANLAVFPLTGFLFYLATIFLAWSFQLATDQAITFNEGNAAVADAIISIQSTIINNFGNLGLRVDPGPPISLAGASSAGTSWSPPLIGMAGLGVPLIFGVAGLILMLQIPKLAEIIKSAMAGQPFGYGAAIGQAFGAVGGLAGRAYGLASPEIAYRAAQMGTAMQQYRGPLSGASRLVGRGLLSYGERSGAQVVRSRETGRVRKEGIFRRGEA